MRFASRPHYESLNPRSQRFRLLLCFRHGLFNRLAGIQHMAGRAGEILLANALVEEASPGFVFVQRRWIVEAYVKFLSIGQTARIGRQRAHHGSVLRGVGRIDSGLAMQLQAAA